MEQARRTTEVSCILMEVLGEWGDVRFEDLSVIEGRLRDDVKTSKSKGLNNRWKNVIAETELQWVKSVAAKDGSLNAVKKADETTEMERDIYQILHAFPCPILVLLDSLLDWGHGSTSSKPMVQGHIHQVLKFQLSTWRRCGARMSSLFSKHGYEARLRGEVDWQPKNLIFEFSYIIFSSNFVKALHGQARVTAVMLVSGQQLRRSWFPAWQTRSMGLQTPD